LQSTRKYYTSTTFRFPASGVTSRRQKFLMCRFCLLNAPQCLCTWVYVRNVAPSLSSVSCSETADTAHRNAQSCSHYRRYHSLCGQSITKYTKHERVSRSFATDAICLAETSSEICIQSLRYTPHNEGVWRSWVELPVVLNLETGWRLMVRLTLRQFYLHGNIPQYQFNRRLCGTTGPRAGLEHLEKKTLLSLLGIEPKLLRCQSPYSRHYTEWRIPALSMFFF